MLNAIISGIFSIIAKLGDMLISPLVSGVSLLIPSIGTFLTSITYYLGRGLSYVKWAFKLFCVPYECVAMLVTVATATISITLLVRGFTLVVKIYNKFKI